LLIIVSNSNLVACNGSGVREDEKNMKNNFIFQS